MLGASAPIAAAGTLSYDGDTLVYTGGDNLDHEVQFRLSADTTHVEIIDIQQFTTIPGDCDVVVANTWNSCPGHSNVRVDLGAGNDTVTTASAPPVTTTRALTRSGAAMAPTNWCSRAT